jgi:hypothetical protein
MESICITYSKEVERKAGMCQVPRAKIAQDCFRLAIEQAQSK